MAHVLDIGTDLDDLLASIGDLTLDTDSDAVAGTGTVIDYDTAAGAAVLAPLVRPGAGLTTPAWYL
jgi:hypothetical protein